MSPAKPDKTIDQVFVEFLADQEARLSDATYQKYENIIEFRFRGYLERYRPDHNSTLGDESEIGPIKVPLEILRACKGNWDIGCVVAKTGREWRFVEVWNISREADPSGGRESPTALVKEPRDEERRFL